MIGVRRPGRLGVAPVLALGLAAGLSGCAVTAVDGTRMGLRSDSFADYVETVFRRQNEVASDLATELDSADPASARYAELDAAELDLLDACLGVNQLAARQRDGDSPGGLKALKLARQTPDCERAAAAAMNLVSDT